ncbi:DUF4231 domain-containing protein [Crassaminicella profunda]|uniref:DUF4231 domain-containing protein n=1 Tax=Crassaminicella profunda TaxID=1286698 RepID=UPI001CA63FAF|nr:DUF4231 domain-containing protein [Crassaminicella profunda]QZY56943.1 DUF4231 domain-containing protein [Crassaminicella profunda]
MSLKEELLSLDHLTKSIDNEIIRNRVENLLNCYIKKATYYKYAYYTLSIVIIVINAGIPIVHHLHWGKSILFVSISSAVASVIASIITLLNIKDIWFRYRSNVKILKKECMLFNCECGNYDDKNREKIFISNIEDIICKKSEI